MITNSQRSGEHWTATVNSRHRAAHTWGPTADQAAAREMVMTADQAAYDSWTVQEKREYLVILSTRVWDLVDELARARLERASLMNSLQTDLKPAADCRTTRSALAPRLTAVRTDVVEIEAGTALRTQGLPLR